MMFAMRCAPILTSVSVLFSEPKIPQLHDRARDPPLFQKFQCSSASRKFLNRRSAKSRCRYVRGFSALQRAENSSTRCACRRRRRRASFSALQRAENSSTMMASGAPFADAVSVLFSEPKIPQSHIDTVHPLPGRSFSALQRAENSSTAPPPLFCASAVAVSVLFSEPKIPQHRGNAPVSVSRHRFSALQRAENSSIRPSHLRPSIFPTAMITLRHS